MWDANGEGVLFNAFACPSNTDIGGESGDGDGGR
jgi:hypothetical protein